jgi:hypothetical protein
MLTCNASRERPFKIIGKIKLLMVRKYTNKSEWNYSKGIKGDVIQKHLGCNITIKK